MDSKLAPNAACRFLRVPLEIRHEIYRYLLLDPPAAFLDPSYDEKTFNEMMEDEHGYTVMAAANEVSEHSSSDSDPEGEGTVMYNHLIVDQPDPSWETHPFPPPPAIQDEEFGERSVMEVSTKEKRIAEWKRKFEDEYKVYRYPAILQTNGQIYDEASTFLYSSLVMEVKPGDVIFSDVWKDIVEPSDKIWRSRPVNLVARSPDKGLGWKGANVSGTMEPHVFAKFERIAFSALLDFDSKMIEESEEVERLWPTFFVDETFHTSREDEGCFTACLNGEGTNRPPISDIFQQFVNVLVMSPYISRLDIVLGVNIEAAFDIDSESDDDREEEMIDDKEERKKDIANKRALELVLEAGALKPLKQLDNVKCFSVSFDMLPCKDIEFEPNNKHSDIIKDLKKTVEGNFLAKCGSL